MTLSDYYQPKPAVLIATNRSGSTFLLNCLDSHPQIGCERSEPLSPREVWRQMLPDVPRETLLRLLWSRPGYRVAMFKMSYKHVRWMGTEILEEVGATLIHLHRGNVLRAGVSSVINTAAVRGDLDHPTHSFSPVSPVQIHLDVADFVKKTLGHLEKIRAMRKQLSRLGLPLLMLTYEDLVGYEGNETEEIMPAAAARICQHLGVEEMPLFSYTRRVNPQPLHELVSNWDEVVRAVRETELAEFLRDE